jgi:hypothetical protein
VADVDVEQMKAALVERYKREEAMRPRAAQRLRAAASGESQAAAFERSNAELRSMLEGDPHLSKLGALLTRRLDGRLKAAKAEQRAQAETDDTATAAKIAEAIEAERTALGLLAQQPSAETYVTLTKPDSIMQLPQGDFRNLDGGRQFKGQHIEPFNSWFRAAVVTNRGGEGAERIYGGGKTKFVAYYQWENPTDHYAIGSATSNMTLMGRASAWGSPGFYSGNWALLYIEVTLTPIRWSGWGTDAGGNSLDRTTYPLEAKQKIVQWKCYGGDWFSDPSPQEDKSLNPFNRLTVPIIAIPGRASIVFELGLLVDWGFVADWGDGGTGSALEWEIDDAIEVDLASGERKAWCGAVLLDLKSYSPRPSAEG